MKHLFRYPFRSIKDKYELKVENALDEEELDYDSIKRFYRRLVELHKKCGNNCKHLQRFYQNIGFKEFNWS